MNSRIFLGPAAVVATLCGLVMGTGGCRKKEAPPQTTTETGPPAVIAPEFSANALGPLPGALYRNQAGSPIHWQPWTKETMARAKAANRLIFAVIAMPQQPGFQSVLANLTKDSNLVAKIHENYVPVLIDGDASREVGLLTADLCAEIKRGVQLPLFVWLTPDANPVAWTPVGKSAAAQVGELFNQSHLAVSQTWADQKSYVLINSARDNSNRSQRMAKRYDSNVTSDKPGEDVVRGIRRLASCYDPYSRSFDEAGGLFPSGAIDLLATAAIHPGLPPEVRSRCLETTRELLVDLLSSAMFDPLDGGVFCSRRRNSWAHPAFYRDCVTQARASVALIHGYQATGNERALAKALDLIAFSEKTFATTEGLFSLGLADESDPAAWLWSVEEIEKELPPEDAAWWIKATGMKDLGNLPSEADPQREYFRSNSLGLDKSPSQLAAESGQAPEVFAQRFEITRKKLLKVRSNRLGPLVRDDCSHAGATFRMVSAYAAAFGVTGDVKFRDKATALLDKGRIAFGDGLKLRSFSKDSPKPIGEGRAFLYALAMQAALDVSVITADDKWLVWSEDLGSTATELFSGGETLKECPDDAKIIDLPVTDRVMLFDDSTAGLIAFAGCRLAERERPMVADFNKLATPLPIRAVERPILHTDLLQATLAREFRVSVVSGAGISPELKQAIEHLPLRMIQRRAAKPKDEIPAGSVKLIISGAEPRLVSTPEALREAVLPSLGKS